MQNKRGPWSKKEKTFIKDNAEFMNSTDIAKRLSRNSDAVEKYMRNNGLIKKGNKAAAYEINNDITRSPHWAWIKKQFSGEEQEMFVYHWNNTVKQFRDDVLHTEELQILDSIKLELLMNRILTQEQDLIKSIRVLQDLVDDERAKDKDLRDKDMIFNYEKQISFMRGSQESINKEYRELLQKKGQILDKMRATRDARIKFLESTTDTMTGWVRTILTNEAMREQLGKDMEKMRIAMEVEYERLSEWHIYEDGQADQPFLVPENVKDE
jgi:hypothetical protein